MLLNFSQVHADRKSFRKGRQKDPTFQLLYKIRRISHLDFLARKPDSFKNVNEQEIHVCTGFNVIISSPNNPGHSSSRSPEFIFLISPQSGCGVLALPPACAGRPIQRGKFVLIKKKRKNFRRWCLSAVTTTMVLVGLLASWGSFMQVGASAFTVPAYHNNRRTKNEISYYFSSSICNQNGDKFCDARGGASESCASSSQDVSARRGMALALSFTYFSVMASKCALPAVLAQLIAPETGFRFVNTSSPQVLIARLLTLSTCAISLGKLFLGPLIDFMGGIQSLKIALSLLSVLLAIISVSDSFQVFSWCWIGLDFIFSSCWAACINACYEAFPSQEWAQRIGMLAAAARTGNAAAFSFFAWVLAIASDRMAQPWRLVFASSALLQIVPLGLLAYFGRLVPKTPTTSVGVKTASKRKSRTTFKAALMALQKEAKTGEFWLHLVSRSVLMVFASFLLFVPLLISEAYGASSSVGAQVGSLYAFGCLISVTLGSTFFAELSKKQKAAGIAFLLGLSTLSSLCQLGHMADTWKLSTSASATSMFLWGLSFAIPFYLPPSLYALERPKISATIADVFDVGGFGLLALFNGYVASIEHANAAAWIPTFQMTTGCSVIALICLTLAVLLD